MADLDAATINAIDERVRRGLVSVSQLGEVVARTSTTDALVVFDGSQGAIPCKIGSTAGAYEGDTVGVGKYGRHWIIVTTIHWRGARRLVVANRGSRPTAFLSYGDQVLQTDTGIEYWWNGSVWVPTGGQTVFSWVRGPGLSTLNKLLNAVTGNNSAYTAASLEVEPSTEYLISSSLFFSSGVGGTHFFKSYIHVGGVMKAEAGENVYTGGNGGQRINLQSFPYITGASETSVQFELRADNGAAGAAYDVFADPTKQAYLHVTASGRTATGVAT